MITPCSIDHPYSRKLKGGTVEFTDPEKLLKFLKCSEEASYMWTDSEDLTVIADMFQVKVKRGMLVNGIFRVGKYFPTSFPTSIPTSFPTSYFPTYIFRLLNLGGIYQNIYLLVVV